MPIVKLNELESICYNILSQYNLPDSDKTILTNSLIMADMRGISSHGIVKLPIYIQRIQKGLINLNPKITKIRESSSCVLIDGDNGLGQVVVCNAMGVAAKKTSKTGICAVSIFNSNHCGMLAFYIDSIIKKRFTGLMVTNAPAFVAPPGGVEARIGSNPICIGVPTMRGFPMILDMAICPAIGKVRLALQNKEEIPNGWAMDSSGKFTTNPMEALKGFLLPIGGAKGFGLGLMVDIFAGILSGATFGIYMRNPLFDLESKPNLGHFFVMLDYKKFISEEEFISRIDELINSIKNTKLAEDANEIFIPGEIEYRNWIRSKKEGIFINEDTWRDLLNLIQQ